MNNKNQFIEELLSIRKMYSKNEWAFSGFCEKYIKCLEPIIAFDTINQIVPILLDGKNIDSWTEIVEVILVLARKSETVEIPEKLKSNIEYIKEKARIKSNYDYNKYKELAKYYRIKE